MDNLGGKKLDSREVPNVLPTPEMGADFDKFVSERTDLKPAEQLPEIEEVAEENAEAPMQNVPEAMPAAEVKTEESPVEGVESQDIQRLDSINIEQDAEQLPKEYALSFANSVEKYKKEPHALLGLVDHERWNLLKKAYGRNLGDGLTGGGSKKWIA